MKRIVVVVALASCGSPSGQADAPTKPSPDASLCGIVPTTPVGGAGSGAVTCGVLTQAGCAVGQKCTWIYDTPTTGHIGCVAAGAQGSSGSACCAFGTIGTAGYDNCVEGFFCDAHACVQICDLQGGAPQCPTGKTCRVQSGVFNGSAGVCL